MIILAEQSKFSEALRQVKMQQRHEILELGSKNNFTQHTVECVAFIFQNHSTLTQGYTVDIKEESHRRKGKGRRCCLGDGNVSIECRTRDLAQG